MLFGLILCLQEGVVQRCMGRHANLLVHVMSSFSKNALKTPAVERRGLKIHLAAYMSLCGTWENPSFY